MQLSNFLAMAASIATASAMPSLQKRALACPASNNTVYSTINGNKYTIECGIDRTGGDISMLYVTSLENCLLACSLNILCLDVSYSPGTFTGPCYMKSAINTATTNSAIMGARLGTGSLTTSSSSTSSSASSTSSTSSTAVVNNVAATNVVSTTSTSSTSVQVAAVGATSVSTTSVATSASVTTTASVASAVATAVQTCGANIGSIAEYPHMIMRVSKSNPSTGYPQVWNGTLNSDIDSIFNFDIKPSYAGKSCTLFFLPPTADQMSQASFPWLTTGSGSIGISALANYVSENVTLSALPSQTAVGSISTLAAGSPSIIYSAFCPAGSRMSFRFTASTGLALDYYQYQLPYSMGVYMSVC